MRVNRFSSGIPRLRATAFSGLLSIANVDIPSTSRGSKPASASAASTASHASCSSLRPEFLENSVAPIPAMAVLPDTNRLSPPTPTPLARSFARVTEYGAAPMSETERPLRPRPTITNDNEFWFDAAREHRLVIQRCASCHALRHPPSPVCPACSSLEWDTVDASGRGTVYSFIVHHHPQHPAFDYPLPIAVVELAEGTRLITDLVDVAPAAGAIGMDVELDFLEADPELTLPVFRPR